MNVRNIIRLAKGVSLFSSPFYLPVIGLAVLFTFSYLSLMPWPYKLTVLGLVYLFTILLPTLLIHFYRSYHGWTLIELGKKERRVVPYLLSIVSYFVCYYVMHRFNIPHFMSNILMSALVIQILCALINVWWKISTHTAAIGGVAGALQAFAIIFGFNPLGWLCVVIILGGMVGSSRMILRQHSLRQVCYGFLLGLIVAYTVILGL